MAGKRRNSITDSDSPPQKRDKIIQDSYTSSNHSPNTNNQDSPSPTSSTASASIVTTTKSKYETYFRFEMQGNVPVGLCLECEMKKKKTVIKRTSGNASGLKKHLKSSHPTAFKVMFPSEDKDALDTQQRTITAMYSKKPRTKEEWKIEICKFIARKRLTFNFFDDIKTQEFFDDITGSTVKMPRRDSARRMVISEHRRKSQNVKKILCNNQSKVSFTIDGWTNLSGRSYYGITVHFVGDDWKMHSMALDFIPAQGKHTGKAIAKLFFRCLEEYQLQNKVQGITVDNAAANTTFMLELRKLMEAAGYSFDNEDQHFRCIAHVLNLAVQDLLKMMKVQAVVENNDHYDRVAELTEEHRDEFYESVEDSSNDDSDEEDSDDHGGVVPLITHTAISKLRNTFKKIRRSEHIQNLLRSFCDAKTIKYVKPILDVSTRWNSTDQMIQASIKMKPALDCLWTGCQDVSNFKLRKDEWSLLIQVHAFLKDFESISTIVGGEKYVTLPLVVLAVNMLLDKIELEMIAIDKKVERTEADEVLIIAYKAARDKIIKHYSKTNWIYCVALILDPRHKVETFSLTKWGKELKDKSVKKFEQIYKEYYCKAGNIIDENEVENTERKSNTAGDMGINLKSLFGDAVHSKHWKDELNEYLSLKRADENQEILQWWKMRENTFPNLSKMARDFFSITATSVPVERLFSLAALVITHLRGRLSDKSITALLCLHSWASCDLEKLIDAL